MTKDMKKVNTRIASIVWKQASIWMSCEKIVLNIEESLGQIPAATHRTFVLDGTKGSVTRLIKELLDFKPDVIAFTDHQVRPLGVLEKSAVRKYIQLYDPKLVFFTFGCFLDRINEYYHSTKRAGTQNIVFVAASKRHASLLRSTLNDKSSESVRYIPFSSNDRSLRFSEHERQVQREKLGLATDELMFLYAGRVSPKKNIDLLIDIFSKLKVDLKIKLFVVGPVDDHDHYLSPSATSKAFQSQTISSLIESANKTNHWITYLPKQSGESLRNFYFAADGFVSLSTQSNEDFGMAVLEALMSGLPCYLTDWGGYSSFQFPQVTFAKLKTSEKDLEMDFSRLPSFIGKSRNRTASEREDSHDQVSSSFGKEALINNIVNLILSPERFVFSGFSEKKIKEIFMSSRTTTHLPESIYGSYWL